MTVAVVGRANVRVADVDAELLRVQAGGDEGTTPRSAGPRATSAQPGRPSPTPCEHASGSSIGRTAAWPSVRTEIVAVAARAQLERGELAPNDAGERDHTAPGSGLDLDLSLDVVPPTLDADQSRVEVDTSPPQRAKLADAQPGVERDRP